MELRIPFLRRRVRWSLRNTAPAVASGVLLLLVLLAVLAVVSHAATAKVAATDVGGPISGSVTWTQAGSPYIVIDTVIVQADAVLSIEPGVEVYFNENTGLQIAGDGQLLAVGTATDPITFTANTPMPWRGFWERIFFDDTSLTSTLRYCVVEYAGTGVSIGGDTDFHTIDHCTFRFNGDGGDWNSGGAIHSAGDELTITNNELYDNELGLRLRKSFGDVISGNLIHDNDGFGIGFIAAGAPGGGNNTISDNQIYGNGGFGLGFISQGIYDGGSNNQILNNDIHDNVAAGLYRGDGLYLDVGAGNIVEGNSIYANEGHGVWAMSQLALQFTGNIVRGNGLNGLTFSDPQDNMTIHSNVLCNNLGFQLQNAGRVSITAEGNWFGTDTPGASEVDGPVDYDPWIEMALSIVPNQLPADGQSTATLTLTMNDGIGHSVADGYPVDITASDGGLSASTLLLIGGQATATYTAGTTPGNVEFQATDGCTTITFPAELVLEAVDLAIDKTGPGGTTHPGERVTFIIDVSELNVVEARDVVITDYLPAGALWDSDTSASCGLIRQSTSPTVVWTKDSWSAGDSCQFELTVLVEGDACLEDRLVNSVEITSATTDDDPLNNSATTGIDSPAMVCLDLAVTKDDGEGAVLVLQPEKAYVITYTFTYSNEGNVDASGVVLMDSLPTGSQVYADDGWICASDTCTHTVDALPIGARQIAPPLAVEVLSCGDLRNEVTIGDDGSQGPDYYPADNTSAVTTSVPCLPDLRVVKNDNVGPLQRDAGSGWAFDLLDLSLEEADQRPCVRPGELITYSIAYANTGVETATVVVLSELLPEYTSYVGGGWTCIDRLCTLGVEDLPPGSGGKADFVVRVDVAPPEMLVLNEVHISSAEPDRDPDDNVSYDDTPICEVCLEVTKDDNLPCAFPGDEIRYTIVFTNVCDIAATDVMLTETLPAYTHYLTTPGWASVGGDQFSFYYGSLAAHASDSVEFAVRVDDPLPDTVTETTNEVCVGRGGSFRPDDCYSLVTSLPLVADLRVVKHDHVGPPPPETRQQLDRFYQTLFDRSYEPPGTRQVWEPVGPGDVFSYTITYLNLGRGPATGVVLTETIPAQTSYVGYGWTHVDGNVYAHPVGDLGVRQGGQVNIWVRVNPGACGSIDYLYNWVRIDGDVEECNLSNNWSGEETQVELLPCEGTVYLPVIMKQYTSWVTPTPSPTPPPSTPTPDGYVSDVAVNPDTNRVYVASPPMDAVFAIDPTGDGSVIDTIPVGRHPLGLAVVTTTNKIYAANLHSWTVTAIRGSDHARLADIYVGAQACKVAADSADARVYATNHLESDNGAAAINSQTDEFVYYYNRLHATQGRYGIDLDPATDKLFIAARDAGLIAIQDAFLPGQEPQLVKLDPPRVPFVVAFNPATEHLFVTAADDNLVVVLDPYSIQWNRGSWLNWHGRPVFVLDRANAGWIAEIGVGQGAEEGIAVNPLTGYVYVTNADSDTVSIIRDDPTPANIQWIMDLAVGEHPQGVDVDPIRNKIYVGNAWSRDLTVIDGSDHTVEKTIPLY